MRILVLSQHFWPETFRINDVTEALHRAGCTISVLTGQPNYPGGQVFDGYHAHAFGVQRHPAAFDIYRLPLVPRGKGGAVRLAINYLSFLFSACVLGPWSLRGRDFDVVFVYGTSPILQAIAGVVLKRTKRAALVTWVQDLWPESLEETGFVRRPALLWAVGSLVRWIYRRSDLVLVQSKAFLPIVHAMAGGVPVEYHPNPGDQLPAHEPAAPPRLRLDSGFNVVFAGNLGTVQSLETLLDAAERLLPHPDIRIVLVGSGSQEGWLRREIERRGLSNVQMPGRFEASAMPALFSQASALLVSLRRRPVMGLTVPSKLQTYLAAGRPILASMDGEGARLVAEAGAGIACPAEDPDALAAAVLRLHAMTPAERSQFGERGRRFHEANFEPEMLAQRLLARLELLAGERDAAVSTESDMEREGS